MFFLVANEHQVGVPNIKMETKLVVYSILQLSWFIGLYEVFLHWLTFQALFYMSRIWEVYCA